MGGRVENDSVAPTHGEHVVVICRLRPPRFRARGAVSGSSATSRSNSALSVSTMASGSNAGATRKPRSLREVNSSGVALRPNASSPSRAMEISMPTAAVCLTSSPGVLPASARAAQLYPTRVVNWLMSEYVAPGVDLALSDLEGSHEMSADGQGWLAGRRLGMTLFVCGRVRRGKCRQTVRVGGAGPPGRRGIGPRPTSPASGADRGGRDADCHGDGESQDRDLRGDVACEGNPAPHDRQRDTDVHGRNTPVATWRCVRAERCS